MEKLGSNLNHGSSPADAKQTNSQEDRNVSMLKMRYLQSLVHASQCRDAYCCLPGCQNMKLVVIHYARNCERKIIGGCPICKQLIWLCYYHAKRCLNETNCRVPFCSYIKHKIELQQLQQQAQLEAQLLMSEE